MNALSAKERFTKEKGYFESYSYIVTYAFGHLFALYDMDEYKYGTYSKQADAWSVDPLPYCPEPFRFKINTARDKTGKPLGKPDAGCAEQYKIIKTLLNRSDVSDIVHCGDADREGEIIVRNILVEANNRKPVYRLWLPEQTPKSILYGMEHLEKDSKYDHLAKEGMARLYIDWLFGINLSRYLSCISKQPLFAGRVLVPIVEAIYDRDKLIDEFQSEAYYESQHADNKNGIDYILSTNNKEKDKFKVDAHTAELNASGPLEVIDLSSKRVKSSSPRLFSLSKLQSYLSKKYKMPLKVSMSLIQGLYEKGYITYPRTNTEYLAEDEKDKVRDIIDVLKKENLNVAFRDSKKIFDNSKIESHSALTPTYKIPNPGSLDAEEQKVYDAIFYRFCAVFCSEECILEKTIITFQAGTGETFELKGSQVIQKGFLQYESSQKDKIVPIFEKGEKVDSKFVTVEKHTAPPPHYTVETLMNFLKNPFKKNEYTEDMSDEDYKAMFNGIEIGTEATRTGIIEAAKRRKYISEKKGTFFIEPNGKFLIETINLLKINLHKEKSAELGHLLKQVNHGEKTTNDVVQLVMNELRQEIDKSQTIQSPKSEINVIGTCPLCGKKVIERQKTYACEDNRWNSELKKIEGCPFSLWKEMKSPKVKYKLSSKEAENLLANGCTSRKIIHGASWTAYLSLDLQEKNFTKFKF